MYMNLETQEIWFAWYPVMTEEGEWQWLRNVGRIIDQRPLVYLGLLPEYRYFKINQ